MQKDFDSWNKLKADLHYTEGSQKLFRRGDIWWCSLGVNIGFEEDGKNGLFERPVVVLKKFSKDALLIVPLTRTTKDSPYYFPVQGNEIDGSAIISQIRLISPKRLQRRMGYLPLNDLKNLRIAIRGML